jgi:hypothetical protein
LAFSLPAPPSLPNKEKSRHPHFGGKRHIYKILAGKVKYSERFSWGKVGLFGTFLAGEMNVWNMFGVKNC